ncbi:MAG TPA: hypothetical protein VGI89_00230 [Rhizomicrobium sp.]|jgi:hypothetical protein
MDLLGMGIDIELTGYSTCEIDNTIDDGDEPDPPTVGPAGLILSLFLCYFQYVIS